MQQSPQEDVYEIRPLAEYTPAELLQQEKEVSGLYLSGHPLDAYREKSAGQNGQNASGQKCQGAVSECLQNA